jgi:hypothetical protein
VLRGFSARKRAPRPKGAPLHPLTQALLLLLSAKKRRLSYESRRFLLAIFLFDSFYLIYVVQRERWQRTRHFFSLPELVEGSEKNGAGANSATRATAPPKASEGAKRLAQHPYR